MLDKSIKSRDKLTLTNANFHSMDLNHSLSNSYMTTSYIKHKDNSKKKLTLRLMLTSIRKRVSRAR